MSGEMPRTGPSVAAEELAGLPADLEILRKLGEGAFARVYLAREPALRRLVALKVLHPQLAGDEVVRRRFEREAQATAGIRHPNVVDVHRVGRLESGEPYIVMEYVEGRTLEELLQATGAPSLDEARRITASVAHALAASHRKGVVHRDVRPDNVIVETETGRVVLVDFGLAAIMETASTTVTRLTQAGQRLGDPRYTSPEQLRGEAATETSDVYALGLLAYELVAGEGPFRGSSQMTIVADQLNREAATLESVRAEVDRAFSGVVARCLRKDPRHRPRAIEVAEELTRARTPDSRGGAGHDGDESIFETLGLRYFQAELRRRKVYRLAAAYAAAAFILLQAVQLVLPGLPLASPELWYRASVAVILGGFPVALVLGWIYDLTAGGVRRTGPLQASPAQGARRWILPTAGLIASIAVAVLVWFLVSG